MNIPRWTLAAAAAAATLFGAAATSAAQGVTTGAVSGIVTNAQGQALEATQIQVVNRTTGARAGTITKADGRFYVPALDPGGPYTVTARRIGFAPKDSSNIYIALGQNVRVDFTMSQQAAQLEGVQIVSTTPSSVIGSSHKGVSTMITDSAIAHIPTLNRNFTDFVILTPQLSTTGPGNSGGGQNNRFNAIQIDGSVASDLFGLGSTGQPGAQAGAKQISLEAIKEYQVLLSPYDIRQGNFTGFMLNAVTKSGSNEFHGSGTYAMRNEQLERNVDYLRASPFSQKQEGFWVGGPVVRDKIFFSVAPEFQQQQAPASGPYLGAGTPQPSPVAQADVDRFINILKTNYNFPDPGTATKVQNENPLKNMFARFDFVNLPGNSRLVTRWNYVDAQQDICCNRSTTRMNLTNNGYNFRSVTNSSLAQLFTPFAGGNFNEALIGFTTIRDKRVTPITAPFVTVLRVPNPNGGTANLVAGTENSSQGNELDQDILELTDNVTMPWRSHRFTIGTKNEFLKVRNLFAQNSYGNFTFATMDSLINNTPSSATLGINLDKLNGKQTDGAARFNARTLGFYAEDEWQAKRDLSVVFGLRLDIPGLASKPGFNAKVHDNLNYPGTTTPINTTDVPQSVKQWSPRVGFNWDVTGDGVNQVRGGSGVFMGRPAYVWLSNLFGNSGVNGFANLVCSTMTTAPAMPNAGQPIATNCRNSGATPAVTVNTTDPNLKFPSVWRTTLGYDRRLPWDVIATVEGMYTRSVTNFYYQNINLVDSIGVDRNGRVLMGDITSANSNVVPTRKTAALGDVIHVLNTPGHDYAYSVTGELQKRFGNNFEGSAAYNYSRSYDYWDLTSSVAFSNWSFGRSYASRQSDLILRPSKWDAPHRIIIGAQYTAPTKTGISMSYAAESGVPFEYVYGNDMNGDNSGANDLVYVPKNAHDPNEIQFTQNGNLTPAMQADSLEAFITNHACLNSQRGEIMLRNSCRTPWTKRVNMSFRQPLQTVHGQHVILQLDIFNFLNLLNKDWGAQDLGSSNSPTLLTRRTWIQPTAGQPLKLVNGAQPVFIFSPFQQFNIKNPSSNYALQLQLKYTF